MKNTKKRVEQRLKEKENDLKKNVKMICIDIGWILLGAAFVMWTIGYYIAIFKFL
jgi:hypothetical protein